MSASTTSNVTTDATATLATFLSGLRYEHLPKAVIERTEDLFLDWLASALAGRGSRPARVLERFAATMGPVGGTSEILTARRRTSPLFAALVNGAASHVVEQDDVHNGAVFHPGAVVFPAALATAQETGASGTQFITAVVAGYEAGIRVGEALGRSHYRVFHTTGTAGTLAAAAAVAHLLGANDEKTLNALGSAGTQAAGLWEFLRDAADSKQLHTAKAAADGLLSAYIARDGFTGARHIFEGEQGMAAGMSTDAVTDRLTDRLGQRWALLETSFKYHASCRHTHPAADALYQLIRQHNLSPDEIRRVRAHVTQAAVDVLGPASEARTIHQSKFSMGFVLSLIALYGHVGVSDFSDDSLHDRKIRAFLPRVEMVVDPEVDAAYPSRWIGLVEVDTTDGRKLMSRVNVPKGDPGNALSRAELEEKAHRLARFAGGASADEMDALIKHAWTLREQPHVRDLLPGG